MHNSHDDVTHAPPRVSTDYTSPPHNPTRKAENPLLPLHCVKKKRVKNVPVVKKATWHLRTEVQLHAFLPQALMHESGGIHSPA